MLKNIFTSGSYARFVVMVAIAATLSYWVGSQIPHTSGLVAALTAVVTVQPTLHRSVKESVWQLLGIVLGVTIVSVVTTGVGFAPLVLFVGILVGYTVARMFDVDLSSTSSIVVPIVIIVGTTGLTNETVLQRTFGALLGAGIAMVVSIGVHSGSPQQRALSQTIACAEEISEIMQRIADTIAIEMPSEEVTKGWRDELLNIQRRLIELRNEAEEACASIRWSPFLNDQETRETLSQVKITQATVDTAINMCRDLVVASRQAHRVAPLPEPLAASLSDVISGTADVIGEQAAAAAAGKPATPLSSSAPETEAVVVAVQETIGQVKDTETTGAILISSSLLRDSEKINTLLTEKEESK